MKNASRDLNTWAFLAIIYVDVYTYIYIVLGCRPQFSGGLGFEFGSYGWAFCSVQDLGLDRSKRQPIFDPEKIVVDHDGFLLESGVAGMSS